ncbi:MAG: bifunctional glutamate N-acetyltransferase/amino-acid acetyltransferase ArgJ [Verrucomicrobia bacterium]|nr:bifunctional glutamate N-acetyltransferase/amino-acid acetyltransferase ArgJ [Verrucomicrobiota bacterium]
MSDYTTVEGGVTAAQGFKASGVCAGIKVGSLDLALVVSETPATVAGTFTTNAVQAAPVTLCKSVLASGTASAVVVNSGCANACTGKAGMVAAKDMASATAAALGLDADEVFVCSTGTIGKPLPVDKIRSALPDAVKGLSVDGGSAAAKAIMTTDTVDKQVAVSFEIEGVPIRLGGMSKGAGMIEPNMATMLAFITTDAAVAPAALQASLSSAVKRSFNRVTVDGDQSTNDTVLLLANGCSSSVVLDEAHPEWTTFVSALDAVCLALAKKMVEDGEGATKFVTITVNGALTESDANRAAKAVANSLLCKTAWFGGDPNWGRVIAAVGYSGAKVDPDSIDIAFNDVTAIAGGQMAAGVAFSDLESVFSQSAFEIVVDLNLGEATDTVYTCDCSYDYVKINAEYMT